MAQLTILSREGDTAVIWSPEKIDETFTAQQVFEDLKAKGYASFYDGADPKVGQRIDTFDSLATEVLMFPQMGGG
jgi:hypothetical protein